MSVRSLNRKISRWDDISFDPNIRWSSQRERSVQLKQNRQFYTGRSMTEHNWRGIIIFKPSNNSYLELEIHSTNFTQRDVVPFDQTFNPMYRITPRKNGSFRAGLRQIYQRWGIIITMCQINSCNELESKPHKVSNRDAVSFRPTTVNPLLI